MYFAIELIFTLWAYSVIGVVCSIAFVIQLTIFPLFYFFDPGRYYVGRLFRLSSVVSCWLNPLWRFSVHGDVPSKPPRSTVIVSNHLSLADSALISFIPGWEMKWMSKSILFFIPVVGWMMYLSGDIWLQRGHKESSKQALQQCKGWLAKGANVMIFPEGTRPKTGKMGDFKDGAFRLAIETQSDLLPLAVAGTDKCIPVSSWKMGYSRGLVRVGSVISTNGMSPESPADIEKLKRLARQQIQDMYEQLKPLCHQPDK